MQIPERLHRLEELAHNIWWSWSPEARGVFRSISVRLWRSTDHNPVRMLNEVTPDRLEKLAADPEFLKSYDALLESFDAYLGTGRNTSDGNRSPKVAYFSAEYGLHESLPIYSGGLGILSGDQAKTASDMGFDFTAVGFMYPRGYFEQEISPDGQQIADYPEIDIPNVAIERVFLPTGEPLMVSLPMQRPDDLLHLQIWLIRCGRVHIYLLDSDVEQNDPANRDITTRLYGGDREYRLRQEIALGIGGICVLRALGIEPEVYHANEGHVAFTFVERLREKIKAGLSREEAKEAVRNSSVFTTHTPVPAGHDAFNDDLISRYFWHYWPELNMSKEEFFALGEHDGMFNMTALSLNLSARTNAVSKKHGEVTAAMWPEYISANGTNSKPTTALRSITNGVHIPTWLAPEMAAFFTNELGTDWAEHLDDPSYWEKVRSIPNENLWHTRLRMKASLFGFTADRVRRKWLSGDKVFSQAGESIIAEGVLLDPSIFTIGFARRFATYKRGTLIFKDLDRLRRIVNDPLRPVQIVFSGKAHPADGGGQDLIKEIWHHALDPAFGGRIAFVENYSMHTAKYLVRGCDIWMNNPKAPLEASGTSGMKAAINGLPNFSVLDGWWIEGVTGGEQKNGWGIEGATSGSQDEQDWQDANRMYEMLEQEIIPLFYDKASDGIPHNWLRVVKEAIATIVPAFSSERMMREYMEMMYRSIIHTSS